MLSGRHRWLTSCSIETYSARDLAGHASTPKELSLSTTHTPGEIPTIMQAYRPIRVFKVRTYTFPTALAPASLARCSSLEPSRNKLEDTVHSNRSPTIILLAQQQTFFSSQSTAIFNLGRLINCVGATAGSDQPQESSFPLVSGTYCGVVRRVLGLVAKSPCWTLPDASVGRGTP